MASELIPPSVGRAWDSWSIQGVLIASFLLQVFLLLFGSYRKKTGNMVVYFMIWSAYFLADWVPTFGTGLILKSLGSGKSSSSASAGDNQGPHRKPEILAIWAAIFMQHLGGGLFHAFSQEDNELWLRHLVGLVVQFTAAFYVFLSTLPRNKYLLTTVFSLVVGFVKYAERVWCMYHASLDKFKESIVMDMDVAAGADWNRQLAPEWLQSLHDSYHLFETFKGQIVNVDCSAAEQQESREYFQSIEPEPALGVIVGEVNFMHEALFTKAIWRNTLPGSFSLVMISLNLRILAFIKFETSEAPPGTHPIDKGITFALLLLAPLFLDGKELWSLLHSHFILLSTNSHQNDPLLCCICAPRPSRRSRATIEPNVEHDVPNTFLLFRQWSESVYSYNLIGYCLEQPPQRIFSIHKRICIFDILCFPFLVVRKVTALLIDLIRAFVVLKYRRRLLNKMGRALYVGRNPLDYQLWEFIFKDLHRKSFLPEHEAARMISENRGGGAIRAGSWRSNCTEILTYIDEVDFGESFLTWHLATEICYNDANDIDRDEPLARNHRVFSKILSDYMLYLMVFKPSMMSTISGIFMRRFTHTCNHIWSFLGDTRLVGRREQRIAETCWAILDYNSPDCPRKKEAESVLHRASSLARELRRLEGEKWIIMSHVWLEMMTYAARHCRGDLHARSSSRGGELFSMVWLLMAHFGFLRNQLTGRVN